MKRTVLLGFGLLLAVGLAAPGFAKKEKGREFAGNTVYTDYHLNYIKLDKISAGDATARGLSHPAAIPVDKMRQMLASIEINRRSMFKKSKIIEDSAVFAERDLDTFAGYFAEAFQRADNEHVVTFSFLSRNPKIIGGADRLNTGTAWVSGTQLHLAFGKLYALVTSDTGKRGYDEKILRNAKGLRVALEAGPGQSLGSNVRELVLDLGATFATKGPAANRKISATVSERLEELKKLRDKKLITPEEYEAKRQAIMNSL